jgi:hypothetical protein
MNTMKMNEKMNSIINKGQSSSATTTKQKQAKMSGRGKGGKAWARGRQAASQGAARQHPRHHQAGHPTSRPPCPALYRGFI